MVSDNKNNPAEESKEEAKYEELVTEESELPAGVEDISTLPTLEEAEQETQQKTDLQAILKVLTPTFPTKRLNDLLQPAMVSRVFPDNLLDKNKLLVLSMLEEHDPDDTDIDVIGMISLVQDALSIGFEGRGIVDRLEIAGVVHEEEMEKITKELGLGGL